MSITEQLINLSSYKNMECIKHDIYNQVSYDSETNKFTVKIGIYKETKTTVLYSLPIIYSGSYDILINVICNKIDRLLIKAAQNG